MQMTETRRTRRGLSDRTLNRLTIATIVVLVVGIPLVGVIYFMDRSVSAGPSMAERAVSIAEAGVRNAPNDVNARLVLASSYMSDQRYADAVAQYTQVLAAAKDNRNALLGRGNAYLSLKDLPNATKDFNAFVDLVKNETAAAADTQLQEAYYRLGDIALRDGRNADAVKLLQSALAIDQSDADTMNLLGAAYLKTGDAKDAVAMLLSATAFVPTGWCEPYQTLAQAYTALGKPAGASYANGMAALCAKQPDVAITALTPLTTGEFALQATLGLGMVAESQGDVATATSLYQKALATDPRNFNAIAGLQRLGTGGSAAPTGSGPSSSPAAPAVSPGTGVNP